MKLKEVNNTYYLEGIKYYLRPEDDIKRNI